MLAHRSRLDRSFERLYQRHARDIYRYAFGVLRNEADAEDVTQTTFLNAYRALERGEQPRVALNWLITIAHNVCRQRFRTAARRPQEVELDFDVADTLVEESNNDDPTPEDIRRALGHLAFNQRAAIVMRELEGRSYGEIAEVLGITTAAVETLIFRARRALREQLEGALTCDEAELAISKQLDGRLSRAEKSQLRAHLRECPDCATFARSQRAQRKALKAFGLVPLPSSLVGLFGGGASIGVGLAAKAAAVVVVAGAVGAGGYDVHHALTPPKKPVMRHVAPAPRHLVVIPPPKKAIVVTASADRAERPKPKLVRHAVVAHEARVQEAPKVTPSGHEHALKPKKVKESHGVGPGAQKQGKKDGASFSHGRHLNP